jgi:hypothetical protein
VDQRTSERDLWIAKKDRRRKSLKSLVKVHMSCPENAVILPARLQSAKKNVEEQITAMDLDRCQNMQNQSKPSRQRNGRQPPAPAVDRPF